MPRRLAVGLVIASLLGAAAAAQEQKLRGAPSLGAGGGPAPVPPPIINASQDLQLLRQRDLAGKPCVSVKGFARVYTVNRNLYDHVITSENSCAKPVKMQVCYYKTTRCVSVETPGRGRKETVLGTIPSMNTFQFEFRERL